MRKPLGYVLVSQVEKLEPHRQIGHNRMTHSLCENLCFYCFYPVSCPGQVVVQKAYQKNQISN